MNRLILNAYKSWDLAPTYYASIGNWLSCCFQISAIIHWQVAFLCYTLHDKPVVVIIIVVMAVTDIKKAVSS